MTSTSRRGPYRSALILVALIAAAADTRAQGTTVTRLSCGEYEAVPSGAASNARPTRLTIQRRGRLLVSVSDWAITRVECTDLNADAAKALVVGSYSGGAHCCETIRVWALESKAPRKVLEYAAGNAGEFESKDLDGDGQPELLLGDDTFAYFDDLCYACSPSQLPLVACAVEKGFQDCTQKFPAILHAALERYTSRLKPPGKDDLKTVEGAALGVLAVSSLLSEEEKGLETVRAAVRSDEVMKWLERARPQVRDWMAARGKKLKDGK
jgi:hypothetical protein